DVVHPAVSAHHPRGAASLVALEWECSRLGEAAKAHGLVDRALASHELDLVRAVAIEQPDLRNAWQRAAEPAVAQTADPDPELSTVKRHRGHHTRCLDAMSGVRGRLRCGHRQSQEDIVATSQVFQGLSHGCRMSSCKVEE